MKKTISLSACHSHSATQSNIGTISSYTVLCLRTMTPFHQNKGGSAQDDNILTRCQENQDLITLSQVGVCTKIGLFLVMLVIISLVVLPV